MSIPGRVTNEEIDSNVKNKKNPKRTALKVVLSLIILFLGFIGYIYFRNIKSASVGYNNIQKSILNKKIAGYDIRLVKFFFSTKKITEEQIINLAKNNCYENKVVRYPGSVQYYDTYIRNMNNRFLSKLGLDSKKAEGILYYYQKVPETDQCWLIWAFGTNGYGIVGYDDRNSEIKIFHSVLNKEVLNKIMQQINK